MDSFFLISTYNQVKSTPDPAHAQSWIQYPDPDPYYTPIWIPFMHRVGSSTRIQIPFTIQDGSFFFYFDSHSGYKEGLDPSHAKNWIRIPTKLAWIHNLHPYRIFLCLLKVLHNIWQTSFLLQILVGTKKSALVRLLVLEKIILWPKLILTRKIRTFLDGKLKRTFYESVKI